VNYNHRHVLTRLRERRHWRLDLALAAHRIERRLGRHLTDGELDRISWHSDQLHQREIWFRFGGWLEVRDGRLELSRTVRPRRG